MTALLVDGGLSLQAHRRQKEELNSLRRHFGKRACEIPHCQMRLCFGQTTLSLEYFSLG